MPSAFSAFRLLSLVIVAVLPCGGLAVAGDALESATRIQVESQREAAASQERIDAMSAESAAMLETYREVLRETDALRAANDDLQARIEDQDREIAALEREMRDAALLRRELAPLLSRQLEALDRFVALDLPFLPAERTLRLERLRALLDDAGADPAEKYRRIVEAWQVEGGYGRSVETYTGTLAQDGGERLVEFLRVGRIALLYLTLDGREAGMWDVSHGHWRVLPDSWTARVGRGIRVARGALPPELLPVPLPPPGESP